MTRRFGILAAAALCVAVVSSARGQDYRSEIMQYVIDPCVMAAARKNARGNVTPRQMAELIKIMNSQQYERAIRQMIPTLYGKTWNQRQALYRWGRVKCIQGQ